MVLHFVMVGSFLFQSAEKPLVSDVATIDDRVSDLAACMWEKAPKQARIAIEAEDDLKVFVALAKGAHACGEQNSMMNIQEVQAALDAARPAKSED